MTPVAFHRCTGAALGMKRFERTGGLVPMRNVEHGRLPTGTDGCGGGQGPCSFGSSGDEIRPCGLGRGSRSNSEAERTADGIKLMSMVSTQTIHLVPVQTDPKLMIQAWFELICTSC